MVPPRLRIPRWKGLSADSEEKHEPVSDIDTVAVDSLKVLDPNRPIREGDIDALIRSPRRRGRAMSLGPSSPSAFRERYSQDQRRTGLLLSKPAAGVPILLNSPAGADWTSGSLMNADRLDAVSQLVGCQRRAAEPSSQGQLLWTK